MSTDSTVTSATLLSAKDAAKKCGVSLRKFKSLVQEGKISPVQRGAHGTNFYSLAQLRKMNFSRKYSGVQNSGVQIVNFTEKICTKLEDTEMTEKISVQDRIEMAANFLIKIGAFLPINKKFYTYIWCQSAKKNKTIAFDVKKEEFKIARKAIELNDEGYNIFFGVHLTNKPMSEHERPKKEDITAQVAIIADLDCKSSWHVDTDKKKYPTIEQAKKFLPFEPSILIDSGGGLHSYVLLSKPIHFNTDEERQQATIRNKDYIEMIRQNAGEFSNVIDGVHDLPRILRLPGTYNLKHGRKNAPLCKVIGGMQAYYPLESLGTLIKPRPITPAKNPSYNTSSINQKNLTQENFDSDKLKNNYPAVGDKPAEQERALAMLKTFSPSTLTYDEWLHIGMALKNNGNTCADWSDWSSTDERFKNVCSQTFQ